MAKLTVDQVDHEPAAPGVRGVYMMHSDEDDVRVAEGVELVSERVSGYRECTETVLHETLRGKSL